MLDNDDKWSWNDLGLLERALLLMTDVATVLAAHPFQAPGSAHEVSSESTAATLTKPCNWAVKAL